MNRVGEVISAIWSLAPVGIISVIIYLTQEKEKK